MAKNVLFLVHGMGHHPAGWAAAENGPIPTLTDAANHYPGFSEQDPLGNTVEFVEIRYDDIFDKILSRWAELADGLADAADVTPDEITKVTERLSEFDEPDNWFASRAMDVAFYVGFALVRRLVQLRVATQIMKTIADHDSDEERHYSLVAHSLGTAVAHDAIHKMGTTNWLAPSETLLEVLNDQQVGETVTPQALERARRRYGEKIFSPGNFKFEAIFMISNTSRLLQKAARNPFESIVRPRFSGGGASENACLRFYNVDHMFDPIGKVKRFRAEEAWPLAATRNTAFDVFGVDHVHDVNVHALEHYLVHPRVHGPLLRAITRHRFSRDDLAAAEARVGQGGDFPKWGERYRDEDLQERVLAALERAKVRGSHQQLVETLVALRNVVDDVRARVGA